MRYIELEGNPHKIGFDFGRRYGDLLNDYFQTNCVGVEVNQSKDDIDERERKLEKIDGLLTSRCPYVAGELKGTADGSGMSYHDVLWLNVYEDVDYDYYYNNPAVKNPYCCTDIVFCRSSDGPVMGKTNDVTFSLLPFFAIQKIKPDKGFGILNSGFISTLYPNAGINSAGLAFAGTSLYMKSCHEEGIPLNFLIRMMLQNCEKVDDAVKFLSEWEVIRIGAHITLVDRDGNAVNVAKFPKGSYCNYPADGILYCTNHVLDERYRHREEKYKALMENSRNRYENLDAITGSADKSIEGMKGILRNHGKCGAICQHGQDGMYTVIAYILEITGRRLLVSQGYPCRNDFQEFRL